MKFRVGAIPDSQEFTANNWKPLKEPGPIVMQCFALPLGILFCALMIWLWVRWTPVTENPVTYPLLLAIVMLSVFPVHELLHLVMHPKFGMSDKSFLGVWPSRMILYAYYTDILSRNRFLAIFGMPIMILSVLPLLICSMIGYASVTIAFMSCFNVFAAAGDIFGIFILLFQVPNRAIVRNQGWRTYWTMCAAKQNFP